MSILEGPTTRDWPVPPSGCEVYGQFVLISFDPVASVAGLKDEIATKTAAALPRLKWLAFIATTAGLGMAFNADGQYKLSLHFYLLGRGLPSDGFPSLCIPISPSDDSHPLNRAPIVPSTPLPWTNFNIHTLYNVFAVVSRIHFDPTKSAPFVVRAQREEIMLQYMEDNDEATDQIAAGAQHTMNVPTVVEENIGIAQFRGNAIYTSDLSSRSDDSSDDHDDEQIAEAYGRLSDIRICVEMWTDLDTCPDPDTLALPHEFYPSLEVLQEIKQAYESRILVKHMTKPETSTWIQAVANTSSFEDTDQHIENDEETSRSPIKSDTSYAASTKRADSPLGMAATIQSDGDTISQPGTPALAIPTSHDPSHALSVEARHGLISEQESEAAPRPRSVLGLKQRIVSAGTAVVARIKGWTFRPTNRDNSVQQS